MAEPKKTEPAPPAPPLAAAEAVPSHIVVTDDVAPYRKGQVLPYDLALVARLDGKSRPATPFDLGVAGIMTR
jgi:hypothetical protein